MSETLCAHMSRQQQPSARSGQQPFLHVPGLRQSQVRACTAAAASSGLPRSQFSSPPLRKSRQKQTLCACRATALPCTSPAFNAPPLPAGLCMHLRSKAGRQQVAAFSFFACRAAAASCGVTSHDGRAAFRQVLLMGAASGERGFAQRMLFCLNPGNAGAIPGLEVMRCRPELCWKVHSSQDVMHCLNCTNAGAKPGLHSRCCKLTLCLTEAMLTWARLRPLLLSHLNQYLVVCLVPARRTCHLSVCCTAFCHALNQHSNKSRG